MDDIRIGNYRNDSSGNRVVPSGRVYGMHENGRAYLVSGPGFYSMDRGEYKAYTTFLKRGGNMASRSDLAKFDVSDQSMNRVSIIFNEVSGK